MKKSFIAILLLLLIPASSHAAQDITHFLKLSAFGCTADPAIAVSEDGTTICGVFKNQQSKNLPEVKKSTQLIKELIISLDSWYRDMMILTSTDYKCSDFIVQIIEPENIWMCGHKQRQNEDFPSEGQLVALNKLSKELQTLSEDHLITGIRLSQ